jgi:hypothetical protein
MHLVRVSAAAADDDDYVYPNSLFTPTNKIMSMCHF